MKVIILLSLLAVVAVVYGQYEFDEEDDLSLLLQKRGAKEWFRNVGIKIKKAFTSLKPKFQKFASLTRERFRNFGRKAKAKFQKFGRILKTAFVKFGKILKKVDWAGIARKILPFLKHGITKMACSRLASAAVSAALKKPPTGTFTSITSKICNVGLNLLHKGLDAIIPKKKKEQQA